MDFTQLVEKLPVVSMRMAPQDGGWKTCFVTLNISQYGYERDDFLSGKKNWLDMIHPDERSQAQKDADALLQAGDDSLKLQYHIISPHGESMPVTSYLHLVRNADGLAAYVDAMIFKRNGEDQEAASVTGDVRQQMALNEIVFSLAENGSSNPLDLVFSKAGEHLGVSRVVLLAQAKATGVCELVHEWVGKGAPSAKNCDYGQLCGSENNEIRTALDNNGTYAISAGEISRRMGGDLRKQGILSALLAAVQLSGRLRACLRFEDFISPHDWSEADLEFARSVASLVSSILMHQSGSTSMAFSQKTCETVLDNVDSFIFVTDPKDDSILFANRAFRSVFGEDSLGKRCSDYLTLTAEQETEAFAFDTSAKNTQLSYETFLEKTGQWLAVTRDTVPWVNGTSAHLNNCYDITFKKNYEDSIKRLAFLDHLTGLPNRYRCDTDLRRITNAAARRGDKGYLFFIDLDDFKVVNDSYGHHYGDGVLVSFAAFLQEQYGEQHHVYRLGGDEFVVVLMGLDEAGAKKELNTLLDRGKKPWKALSREFYCSLSIGAVEISAKNADPKSILQQADIAMYQAKRNSKNSFVFFTEGLESSTIERSEMEWLLREAMDNNFQGFEIYYQPYSRASDLKILGAEALVRMRDKNGKLLLPRTFVPLAEYLGFIVPLGEHVLRTAATQCKAVNDSGLPDFSITINLSAREFQQKDTVDRLEHIMRSTGVNFNNMIFSINEGVAIKELKRMLQISGKFREHGIRIALDDFGSGTSSFINMRDLPVDIVKVSSNYIDEYKDEYSGYFVRLVADLSHFSGKLVCMNGVEKTEHYDFCKELGVDMVQGFLFHRPDSVEALNLLLK